MIYKNFGTLSKTTLGSSLFTN